MKTMHYKLFSFIIASALSFTATAQSDTGSAKPFKEIFKEQETDRPLEKEIKKKELQQAPSLIVVANDSSALKKAKKYGCRKKKKQRI
ncbi:MAG: hypothetical protein ACXWWC_05820 [Chitinophagaceae bacterium]